MPPGTGWAGTPYEHYDYPGLYGSDDFHHCGLTGDDDIADYDSREQVQTCELVNLADLDTSRRGRARSDRRPTSSDLLSLGVAGFRIDAAKHMAADDVAAIVEALPEGTRIISEVIRGGGEPIQPEEYAGFGEVFEFTLRPRSRPAGARAGRSYDPSSRRSAARARARRHPPSSSSTTTTPNAARRTSPTATAPCT